MGLRVALAGVAGVQDREEDPAWLDPVCSAPGGRGDQHGGDSVGDHPMHGTLRRRYQRARERPDPARPVKLLHWPQNFCYVGVEVKLIRRHEITLPQRDFSRCPGNKLAAEIQLD